MQGMYGERAIYWCVSDTQQLCESGLMEPFAPSFDEVSWRSRGCDRYEGSIKTQVPETPPPVALQSVPHLSHWLNSRTQRGRQAPLLSDTISGDECCLALLLGNTLQLTPLSLCFTSAVSCTSTTLRAESTSQPTWSLPK